jgi:hypothetical protein
MPAIFMFPRLEGPLTLEEVLEELSEVIDFAIEVEDDDADDDSGIFTNAVIRITDPAGESGKAEILIAAAPDRDPGTAELVEVILEQAEELRGEMTNNTHDVIVRSSDEDADCFAGLVVSYAIATVAECGLLVTGIPHMHGDDCGHEEGLADDEDNVDPPAWFDTPDDFADMFFGPDEDDEECEDEDEGGRR